LCTLSGIPHVLPAFLRREHPFATGSRPQFVDPRVPQDAKYPARQRGIGAQLMGARQSSFECHLHQVVGVMRVSREGTRKAPQPGQ
jgi:hypothetical protein